MSLREICEAAPPGPWEVDIATHNGRTGESTFVVYQPADKLLVVPASPHYPTLTFIATFDPTLVAALLDVVEAARRADEHLVLGLQHHTSPSGLRGCSRSFARAHGELAPAIDRLIDRLKAVQP